MPTIRSCSSANASSPRLVQRDLTRGRLFSRRQLPSTTHELALFLLGKELIHHSSLGPVGGFIVEVEAYPPGDEACHCHAGQTPRNAPLYLAHGHIYMYRCYGTSLMLNISAERAGTGAGVLVRALAPTTGLPLNAAEQTRRCSSKPGARARPTVRSTGPFFRTLRLAHCNRWNAHDRQRHARAFDRGHPSHRHHPE
jgi:DNA-3-methyladenine glycosylase